MSARHRGPCTGEAVGWTWVGAAPRRLGSCAHECLCLCFPSASLPLPSPLGFLSSVAPRGPASPAAASTHYAWLPAGPRHSACLLSGDCFSCFPSGGEREGRLAGRPAEFNTQQRCLSGFQGLAALQGPHYLGRGRFPAGPPTCGSSTWCLGPAVREVLLRGPVGTRSCWLCREGWRHPALDSPPVLLPLPSVPLGKGDPGLPPWSRGMWSTFLHIFSQPSTPFDHVFLSNLCFSSHLKSLNQLFVLGR